MPDLETPEADAAEQQQVVAPPDSMGPESMEPESPGLEPTVSAPPKWDADEGDVAESSIEVPLDEEDYR